MPVSRWIVVSALSPNLSSASWTFDLAAELSQRHAVLLWDTSGAMGKTADQLLPFLESASPDLLRNFLSWNDTSLGVLRGTPPTDTGLARQSIALLQTRFDFIIVIAPPGWDADYLYFLDPAQLLIWLIPPESDGRAEVTRQREALARHQFPKALGLPISLSEKVRGVAHRLETENALYSIRLALSADAAQEAKSRIHLRLLESTARDPALPHDKAKQLLEHLIAEEPALPASRDTRGQVLSELMHTVMGLGPLEPLLKDPEVSEIMVNGPQTVFVEKKGRLFPAGICFEQEAYLRTVIDRIVAPIGRRVDESSPVCDARLPDGSRVNIVLPPLALDGPTLTIRKFPNKRLLMDDLITFGALTDEMAELLKRYVQGHKNIIISGGTGSGKTTLLNILSGFIAPYERIVTIEDAAELKLQQPHVVRLESRPANAEGQGAISIRRLVINALRMRPDRIVVGECRGGEALDMLQAMNTGHDGSLTTLHANTPRDALGRLEALVLMAGIDLPVRVVREQIKSAVHVIVQIARLPDGGRKVTSITELLGMEGDVLTTAEVFRYREGRFESTGLMSRAHERH